MARRNPEDTRFWRIAGAGAVFQGGSAAVDSATVVASLVHMLTGSALAVGYASTVLRLGWLLPQFAVGYLAERTDRPDMVRLALEPFQRHQSELGLWCKPLEREPCFQAHPAVAIEREHHCVRG